MLARYASAVTSGTFVTFGLLFVMQLLITLQPGVQTEAATTVPVDWIDRRIPELPVTTRKEVIDKKKLTEAEVPPVRPRITGGQGPLSVPKVDPIPPAPTGPGTIGSVFTDGPLVAMVRVAPVYPARALTYGIEGYVVVQFDISAEGQVLNVVIIESTDSVFDSAAIKAAKRFKFKPRVVNGLALASYGIQNMFRFRLDDL